METRAMQSGGLTAELESTGRQSMEGYYVTPLIFGRSAGMGSSWRWFAERERRVRGSNSLIPMGEKVRLSLTIIFHVPDGGILPTN
jgi:hypothetical protein